MRFATPSASSRRRRSAPRRAGRAATSARCAGAWTGSTAARHTSWSHRRSPSISQYESHRTRGRSSAGGTTAASTSSLRVVGAPSAATGSRRALRAVQDHPAAMLYRRGPGHWPVCGATAQLAPRVRRPFAEPAAPRAQDRPSSLAPWMAAGSARIPGLRAGSPTSTPARAGRCRAAATGVAACSRSTRSGRRHATSSRRPRSRRAPGAAYAALLNAQPEDIALTTSRATGSCACSPAGPAPGRRDR